MTIDEEIAKYKEITNTDALCPGHCKISCDKCVQESEQLVEWLEELKDYRHKNKIVVHVDVDSIKDKIEELSKYAESQYDKAIDDFVKELQKKIEKDLANHDLALECKKCGIWKNYDIEEIAEQLKAGGQNVQKK